MFRAFRRRRYYRFSRQVPGAIRSRVTRGVVLLVLVIVLHIIAMMSLEDMSLSDATWLTLTTATTVGYGDMSAVSPLGRTFTVILMYLVGIFLLAQVATDILDYRSVLQARKRMGTYKWKTMKDHLLIINSPASYAETYLPRLMEQIRNTPTLDDIPVQILTTAYPQGLPDELVMQGVTQFSGMGERTADLEAANAQHASYIFVVATETNNLRQDALTYDVMSRLKELGTKATIIAEVVDDQNRPRTIAMGASTVIRPVRAYPELVVRAMVEPGTEQVLENLFSHKEDRLITFEVNFSVSEWRQLLLAFVQRNSGIPMGYIDEKGVHTNPVASSPCAGTTLIILVSEDIEVDRSDVDEALASLPTL